MECVVLDAARRYRKDNPGLGCAKLHRIISASMGAPDMMGRDSFVELLRENDLMVRLKRRRRYRTTNSEHNYRKYPNLIAGVVPNRPNQIWVADITYVETDRGCQYCSHEYVGVLKKLNIGISMTQSGDSLENAVAERANGILKTEWLYKMKFATRKECQAELERIIPFYNGERPHMSIGMQTPNEAHGQERPQKRCWKTPRERREAGKKISLDGEGPVGSDNQVG